MFEDEVRQNMIDDYEQQEMEERIDQVQQFIF